MKAFPQTVIAVTILVSASLAAGAPAPKRVVVDPSNPAAASVFRSATSSQRSENSETLIRENPGVQVPWESHVVLYSESRQDSFLVKSSRRGCPGTEVKPSVSVAFATARGWSDPPIRFGPLASKTTCALGKGVELQVCAIGRDAPFVKLIEKTTTYTKR